MSWVLNVAYGLLLIAVSPVLVYRMLAFGKYRAGWRQKFLGMLPVRKSNRPCVWFHAVSVGEVLQLEPVLKSLQADRPDVEFLITTTTSTGHAVAREKFPQHGLCYFPLDFSWAVSRAIRRIRPAAIVLVELELWPNFILAAKRAGIPLTLINGRISERSFRGYRRIQPLMKRLLHCFHIIAVQNETYADRLIQLGAPKQRIQVTGSIKFDRVESQRRNPQTDELRQSFGIGDARVFIAGSTQDPEEQYALDTWLALQHEHPDLRLILVPRHKERFEQVAQMVEKRGLPLIRRSAFLNAHKTRVPYGFPREGEAPAEPVFTANMVGGSAGASPSRQKDDSTQDNVGTSKPAVLLLDTLGELSACWGLADIAFVGGSLTKRGGQNMIEPAAFGAAVLFGPNTQNFQDVVDSLLSRHAARVVRNPEHLTQTVRLLLESPEAARKQGQLAQQLVFSQQGATRRTLHVITQLLPPTENDRSQPVLPAA
jgi:3-deoxy-D-manno-octulosonic-acid transferase